MTTRHTVVDTKLGPITILATRDAITGIYFAQHVCRPRRDAFGPRRSDDRLLNTAGRQLVEYLNGARQTFNLPRAAVGDTFQRKVWAIVNQIPFGRTMTYGTIAAELGDAGRAKDVGRAVGANPLCILVPCHRVVGASGALTGYAGGLARKRLLLDLEQPAAVTTGGLF
jgi:methylated-DNA-[protein]-cysteine S-methyltransferase